MLLFGLPKLQSYIDVKQSQILLKLLINYNVNEGNLGWFVLDNATNKNTVSIQLLEIISFDLVKKRLQYTNHLINLALKLLLDGDHLSNIEAKI